MSRIWRRTHMWTSSNSWSPGDHSSTCLGFLDRPCNHQRNLHSCNHQCSHQLHHPCHHRHHHYNFNGYHDHGHSHRYMHLPDSWSVTVVPPVLTSSSPKQYNSAQLCTCLTNTQAQTQTNTWAQTNTKTTGTTKKRS